MKITNIQIRNLFGIKEAKYNGNDVELSGENAVNKSGVIDAIRLCLTNRSDRDFIIHKGEDEGEILIETDTGLSINRKFRTNKADYKSIKDNGLDVQSPESLVRSLFTELQLDPVKFLGMSQDEQNRIILNMIDFEWDLNWIVEQFGEIVPKVNYDQNILGVLHEIQMNDGFYFQKREEINREIRNNKAMIVKIGNDLPDDYKAEDYENVNLGEKFKEIEKIRLENAAIDKAKTIVENFENKKRSFEAELAIELQVIEREATRERSSMEASIMKMEEQIRDYKKSMERIEEKKITAIEIAKKTSQSQIAKFVGQVEEYKSVARNKLTDFSALQAEAEHLEKMKSFVNEYKRMCSLINDVEVLTVRSGELTAKIEKARSLPGEILENSKIGIEGITVKDGLPLINGLPVSNLSEGEKLNLCVDIAAQKTEALQILLIDGIEKLSSVNRKKLYKKLKEKGVQFISTRTSDEKILTVTEL